jgi:hypothetical protein
MRSDVDVRDGGRLRESVALVHDVRVVTQLREVLTAVVGAEEQLTADVERRANIGLGTTAVAAIRGGQGGRQCGGHIGLLG